MRVRDGARREVQRGVREEHLAKDVVQHEQLQTRRQISVDAVFSELLVVLQVVFLRDIGVGASAVAKRTHLEGRAVRNADGQVGKDSKGLVGVDPLER